MKYISSTLACVALVLVVGAAAAADVAFSTFGPTENYTLSGYILDGPQSEIGERNNGFRFVSQASGQVTLLVVPVRHDSGQNSYLFQIYSDSAQGPATNLGTIAAFAGAVWSTPPGPAPLQVPATGAVTLQAGTAYWLIGRGLGTAEGVIFQNDQGVVGPRAYGFQGDDWLVDTQNLAAFRIEVAASCPADFDHNGQVQPADVSLFVSTWLNSISNGTLDGDFDHNGAVQPADVSLFVSTWFAALSTGC